MNSRDQTSTMASIGLLDSCYTFRLDSLTSDISSLEMPIFFGLQDFCFTYSDHFFQTDSLSPMYGFFLSDFFLITSIVAGLLLISHLICSSLATVSGRADFSNNQSCSFLELAEPNIYAKGECAIGVMGPMG